jgi:hypothetical protein
MNKPIIKGLIMKTLSKIVIVFILALLSPLYAETNTTNSITVSEGIDLTPRGLDISALYLATFNRFPDAKGLKYWEDSVFSLEEISESFFYQRETQILYPENDPTELFVEKVYLNYLNRGIDDAGLSYWSAQIDEERIIRGHFILAVINGVKGDDVIFVQDREEVLKAFMKSGLDDTQSDIILKDLVENDKDSAIELISDLSNEDAKIAEFGNAKVEIVSYPKETNETTVTVKLKINEVPRRQLIELNDALGAFVYPITITMLTMSGKKLYNYTDKTITVTKIKTPIDTNTTK